MGLFESINLMFIITDIWRQQQGGARIAEGDRWLFFTEMAQSGGLSRYVIRGITILGRNITIYGITRLHNIWDSTRQMNNSE
jgi:hypothetical protein